MSEEETPQANSRPLGPLVRRREENMEAINGIKIFQIDEEDWVAAIDADEARRFYRDEQCADYPEEKEVVELSDDDLQKTVYVDDAYQEENTPENSRSFADELKRRIAAGQEFPQMFATSDY